MIPIIVRQSAIYLVVVVLLIYAWKDWFRSLCGLILLTAVMGRPEFPQSLGGLQGCNVWNILFANVFLSWLLNRRREKLPWDMPTTINILLVLWLGVIVVGWVRMVVDRRELGSLTPLDLTSEQLINTIKWPMLSLPLFDGCRTRHHVKVALACILLFFTLFAVQIARCVPPRVVLEPGNMSARGRIPEDVGISINGSAKMMCGVPWAMLAVLPLLKTRKHRFLVVGTCFAALYTVALAGSRMGYMGCAAAGVLLCLLRWRRYLLLLPLAVFILSVALPGARSRILQGFGETDIAGEKDTNEYNVTAGRNLVWPYVTAKISQSPVFGFGREAMVRTGVKRTIEKEVSKYEAVAHPHSAYLEVLLDNGLIGLVIILGLHMFFLVYSARLFVGRGDPLCTATGGVALALVSSHLVDYIGGQSFYPKEIDVGFWCAVAVMLRLWVAQGHLVAQTDGTSLGDTCICGDITASRAPMSWVDC